MSEKPEFDQDELNRYARHISLPSFGLEGQRKLKQSSVLCIGAGGLGSPCTMYLAAAGIGRIGIMDMDTVDESNIQRQLLHGTDDVGLKKVNSAKRTLNKINPNVKIELLMKRLMKKTPKQQQKNMTSSLMGQTISPHVIW